MRTSIISSRDALAKFYTTSTFKQKVPQYQDEVVNIRKVRPEDLNSKVGEHRLHN